MNKLIKWLFISTFLAFVCAFFYIALRAFWDKDYLFGISSLVTSLCCIGFIAIEFDSYNPYA